MKYKKRTKLKQILLVYIRTLFCFNNFYMVYLLNSTRYLEFSYIFWFREYPYVVHSIQMAIVFLHDILLPIISHIILSNLYGLLTNFEKWFRFIRINLLIQKSTMIYRTGSRIPINRTGSRIPIYRTGSKIPSYRTRSSISIYRTRWSILIFTEPVQEYQFKEPVQKDQVTEPVQE